MLKMLIEQIAKRLVDKPESVSVIEVQGQQSTVIELRVAPEDLGKVIGKEGRTARSLRTLVHAVGVREKKRVVLEILE